MAKEREKDPLGRTPDEVKLDEECEKIREWAITTYPEVLKKILGKEDSQMQPSQTSEKRRG